MTASLAKGGSYAVHLTLTPLAAPVAVKAPVSKK
jgi:hypothetical protein